MATGAKPNIAHRLRNRRIKTCVGESCVGCGFGKKEKVRLGLLEVCYIMGMRELGHNAIWFSFGLDLVLS